MNKQNKQLIAVFTTLMLFVNSIISVTIISFCRELIPNMNMLAGTVISVTLGVLIGMIDHNLRQYENR
jgi:hypothetical protein